VWKLSISTIDRALRLGTIISLFMTTSSIMQVQGLPTQLLY